MIMIFISLLSIYFGIFMDDNTYSIKKHFRDQAEVLQLGTLNGQSQVRVSGLKAKPGWQHS